jgi:hypothetical protein
MRFYDFLFSGYYYLLKFIGAYEPPNTAVYFLVIGQFLQLLLLERIFKLIFGIRFLPHFANKFHMALLLLPWLLILFQYYKKPRRDRLVNQLEKKSEARKLIIGSSSFIISILPPIITEILRDK